MLPHKHKAVRFFGGVDAQTFGEGNLDRGAPPALQTDFYVWAEAGEPIGPVSVDQIARGILAGRVPLQAYVTRAGDPEWRKVLERREIVRALELSPAVEIIDVIDDEDELVEIFDDEDDVDDAIERATRIYEAKELTPRVDEDEVDEDEVDEVDDADDAGTGNYQAAGDDSEQYRSREVMAFRSAPPESELASASASEHAVDDDDRDNPVASALANALTKAAEQGRWDVVLELARQLETRRPGASPDATLVFAGRIAKP